MDELKEQDDHARPVRNRRIYPAEWRPADIFRRAAMRDIFDIEAPLDLDIGCGEGAFLIEMARRHPERCFLGTERQAGRVETVCRKAANAELSNVRVLQLESAWTLQHLLPLGSISDAYVLFPDPWPKRHHHSRRLIQESFMEIVHATLAPDGSLFVKTDDLPYFQWMEKVFAKAKGFERADWPSGIDYPVTNFERRFLAQGMPIYSARLRKL